jgi:hypothetical protein
MIVAPLTRVNEKLYARIIMDARICLVLCVMLTILFNMTGPIESNKYMYFQALTSIKFNKRATYVTVDPSESTVAENDLPNSLKVTQSP